MDDRMTLAALRVRAGYTQSEAAAKIGVSKATIAKWEQDSRNVPMLHIEKLKYLYQVPDCGIYVGEAAALSDRIHQAYEAHAESVRGTINVSKA